MSTMNKLNTMEIQGSEEEFVWISAFPDTSQCLAFNQVSVPRFYSRCNPSIMKTEIGYRVIVRAVNYKIENDHDYKINDPSNTSFHTESIVVEYDKEWNKVGKQRQMKDESKRQIYPAVVSGLEDCRQVQVEDKLYTLFSCAESNRHGIPETVLLQLQSTAKRAKLTNFIPLEPRFEQTRRKEKNWLPFSRDKSLFVLYNQQPLIILKIDPDTGKSTIVASDDQSEKICSDVKEFRGSAGPVPYKKGYLYLIHQVVYEPRWIYRHRWVYMDNSFKMKTVSRLFSFYQVGIEFACGLCYMHDVEQIHTDRLEETTRSEQKLTSTNPSPDKLIVTFGVRDAEAYRMQINISDVDSLLHI